jgi:hypothetical protein
VPHFPSEGWERDRLFSKTNGLLSNNPKSLEVVTAAGEVTAARFVQFEREMHRNQMLGKDGQASIDRFP